MARRGRCRCGTILKFRRGPNGYKTRCPACGAVVRLRVGPRRKSRASPIEDALEEAASPTEVISAIEASQLAEPLTETHPATNEVISAAASALPSQILPAVPADEDTGAVECPNCGAVIPPHRKTCPVCDTRKALIASIANSQVELEAIPPREPRRRRKPNPAAKWLIVGLLVGAVVLGVLIASL